MNFVYEVLRLGFTENFVWHRDTGDLVIVVIDDECGVANKNPDNLLDPQQAILPQLREQACGWIETRGIGFFRLMDTTQDADRVLQRVDEWLNGITTSDTQVYFLVDFLYAGGVSVTCNYMIEKLTSTYNYEQDHVAYLTRAAEDNKRLLNGYQRFRKAQNSEYIRSRSDVHPNLRRFLGLL